MIYFLITIISLLTGYWLGLKSEITREDVKPKLSTFNFINPKTDLKVGPIKRPDARELNRRKEDPKVLAEKKALLDSLNESDLRMVKEKIDDLKAKGVDVNAI